MYSLRCHYMYENKSWHTYSYALGFLWKTGGMLVNIWDGNDIHVCVHTRNILWARGYFRNVKVPSSPYKRGREGTCKWIHLLGSLSTPWEILSLLSRHHCVWTSLLFSLLCSGIWSGFSDTPNNWVPLTDSPGWYKSIKTTSIKKHWERNHSYQSHNHIHPITMETKLNHDSS
jgi:hypothetical protein